MKACITVVALMDERKCSTEGLNADWTGLISALMAMSTTHGENTKKAQRVKDSWNERRREVEKTGVKLTYACVQDDELRDMYMTKI